MRSTEEDRKAFYKDQETIKQAETDAEDAERIQEWLNVNPEVGVLNNGKYYRIVDGKTVFC